MNFATASNGSAAKGERNDCSVKAVAIALGESYDHVHDLFLTCGRRRKRRTPDSITDAVLKKFGEKGQTVRVVNHATRPLTYNATHEDKPNRFRSKTVVTLEREIQRKDPEGVYLIRTRGHILAFADGKIQDWTAGRRHVVREVYYLPNCSKERSSIMATKKKAEPKKATKAPAKKKAAPKAKSASKNGQLRKPQIRILQALRKVKALTRAEIAEKAPVDAAFCTSYIGSLDPEIRKKNDAKIHPSLLTLGMVKATKLVRSGKEQPAFQITDKGREACDG